ncbi:MAG TPA: DUF2071 domain-containing protein [Candidatus Acidoferrales bacterium]|jgi:uncharacterized protein YqjF (DUF2071 family)|nr:DUF2071 domain-containing protein [Candidatus Acidoferrales bacterium]
MNTAAESNLTYMPSAQAHQHMLSQPGEPLFIVAWLDVIMIHFEVDAEALQRDVPFELDLWNDRAFVSLIAFTMRGMRPQFGGKLAALLFHPIANHHFLNVRTYVRHGGECGIHFLAEWLTNRLTVMLGPATFGLPYRYGRISYRRDFENGDYFGRVTDSKTGTTLTFEGRTARSADFRSYVAFRRRWSAALPLDGSTSFQPCPAGSLGEWLMERYVAFNAANGNRRFFRVWHPPWPQRPAEIVLGEKSLLTTNWPWFDGLRIIGANFSPGFDAVWMGRPHLVP